MTRLAVALVAAVALALAVAQSGSGSFPAAHERLLFFGESTFGTGIFAENPDGTKKRQLAIGPDVGINGFVAVSPDGTKIAYTSTVPFELPPNVPERIRRQFPKLPPSRLGFSEFALLDLSGGSGSIQVIGVGGAAAVPAYGRPAWSPDGNQLAFASGTPGQLDVYVLDALRPSLAPVNITPNTPGNDQNPSWSPDGRSIAFESNRDGNSEIYVASPDGTGARNLTLTAASEALPDWSPDGAQLVYSGNATGRDQLYVLPAAGGAPARLTNEPGDDRRPAWSPDGRWIAFSNNADGENDVFLIDPVTKEERRLTNNASEDLVQGWQPLHDTSAPVVKALASSSVRGKRMVFRYRVSDNSGRARVSISFTTPDGGGGFGGTGLGVVHGLTKASVPWINFPGERLPDRFRFCVSASDPSGNDAQSCASYRLVKRG
jgi:Tol biopolymer transport system component